MNNARLAFGFGVVVVTFVVVRLLLVEPVVVRQESMEPTLSDGDTAVVSKWCRWTGTWGRGDVVAVRSPVDGGLLVKRIVATAGHRVGLRDGRLAIDGDAAPPDAVPSDATGESSSASPTVGHARAAAYAAAGRTSWCTKGR